MRQIRELPVDIAWKLALHDAWRMGHCCGRRANLIHADLVHAEFAGADFRSMSLRAANFRAASLRGANFRGADLRGADLTHADLTGANLCGADFRGANLARADFTNASLRGANFRGANLRYAHLCGADLTDARGLAYQIPQEGELIVYKRVVGGVVKLRIPPEAKRTASIIGRKCRAEWAEVLEGEGWSTIHPRCPIIHYAPGLTVYPDSYDPDPRVECTHGIHFFLSREEAE